MNLQRFIVYGMRHSPKELGVELDDEGYCSVSDLLKSMNLSYGELMEIIDESGNRLCLSEDKTRIRAAHGHSVNVSMDMSDVPPNVLYHGTSRDCVATILESGILPMGRKYVHLSESSNKASQIGSRHSSSVAVLIIDSKRMKADGIGFHRSEDGVWLTEFVSPKYILGQSYKTR